MTINSATGLITIPAGLTIGDHNFTITATNAVGSTPAQNFTLTVSAITPPPTITSANNHSVVSGTGGSFQVTATPGGVAPITYSLTGHPTGVSINSTTGLITIAGTTAVGTHTFTVTASHNPSASQSFTLTVRAATTTQPPGNGGDDSGGGGGGGSGGGGGGGIVGWINGLLNPNAPTTVTQTTANTAVQTAITAATGNNATTNIRNPGDIALSVLQSMANC